MSFCVSPQQDQKEQSWVWALQHFGKYTVRRYKERSAGPGGPQAAQWWLVFHMLLQTIFGTCAIAIPPLLLPSADMVLPHPLSTHAGVAICIASLILIIWSVSEGFLESNKKSWVPTFACVVFGAFFTDAVFAALRLEVAQKMRRTHDACDGDLLLNRFLYRIVDKDEEQGPADLWEDGGASTEMVAKGQHVRNPVAEGGGEPTAAAV